MGLVVIAIVIIVVARMATKPPPPAEAYEAIPCPTCGYDCRATPDRCPECGTPVPRVRRPLDPAKLRDHWPISPIEPRKPALDEILVQIWHAPNSLAADLLVEQFRERGILAAVQRTTAPMQLGNYTAPPANATVAVWSADVQAAESIMELLAEDVARDSRVANQTHPTR